MTNYWHQAPSTDLPTQSCQQFFFKVHKFFSSTKQNIIKAFTELYLDISINKNKIYFDSNFYLINLSLQYKSTYNDKILTY